MYKGKTYTKKIGRQTPSVKVLIKSPERRIGVFRGEASSGLPVLNFRVANPAFGLATRRKWNKKNPPGKGRVYAKSH